MSFKRSLLLSVSIASTAIFSAHAQAPAPAAPAGATPPAAAIPAPLAALQASQSGALTRQDVKALVKETLMEEPEIVMQVIQKLREKQAAESEKKAKEALQKNKDALFNDPDSPTVGDKSADVTIVEFFDYHCGYCKHALAELTKVMNEDKKVRVVFKEFPILSEDSVMASRAALAVNRVAKDKYFAFHTALMAHDGKFDEKALADIAKKVGVPADKMKAEMQKPEITAALDKNREIAEAIGIRGTPAFVINDSFSPGAMDADEIKKAIAEARGGKKADAPAPTAAKPEEKPAIGAGKPEVAKPAVPAAAPAAPVPAAAAPAVPPPPAPAQKQ